MSNWPTQATLVAFSLIAALSTSTLTWAQENGGLASSQISANRPQLVMQLANPSGGAVALSPDGRLVMAGGCLWEVTTGGEVRCFGDRKQKIRSAAFSLNGQFVLTGGSDGTARVWNAATGQEIQRFAHPTGFSFVAPSVEKVAFSLDNRFIVTSSGMATYVWELLRARKSDALKGTAVRETRYFLLMAGSCSW